MPTDAKARLFQQHPDKAAITDNPDLGVAEHGSGRTSTIQKEFEIEGRRRRSDLTLDDFSLFAPLSIGRGAAPVVFLVGMRMTDLADRIAHRTGLGAVVGCVLLRAATMFSAP